MKKFMILSLVLSLVLFIACDDDGSIENNTMTDDDDQTDEDNMDDDLVDDDQIDEDNLPDDDQTDDDILDDDSSVDDDDTQTDDDQADDDLVDDDATDDDFVPPSPVYGYYQESGNYTWLEAQLPVFAANDLTLFLGLDDVMLGDPDLLNFLRAADAAGVDVRAWVLVPYAIGYWAGETNAEAYSAASIAFAEWFIEEDLPIEWIVVDMETDVNTMHELNDLLAAGQYLQAVLLLLSHYSPLRFEAASQIYQQMVDDLHEMGFYAMVVTAPMILDDMGDSDTFLQDVMDIPVSTVNWDEVSTMVYTTTFDQYAGIDFGPYLVYDYAKTTVEYFGEKASIALGLANEWETAYEMAKEVAAAKAAGIERIQVYAYWGAAAKPNPEDWHDTFQAQAQKPLPEASTWILRGLLQLADEIF